MLIEKVNKDKIAARKKKDAVAVDFIGYFYSECFRLGTVILENGDKTVKDESVIATAKKLRDSISEAAEITRRYGGDASKAEAELAILNKYIPSQLSEAEIANIIDTNEFAAIKDFMAFMKKNHAGLYDGKLASSVWNTKKGN